MKILCLIGLHNWEISHENDYVTIWFCKHCAAMREEYHGQ